MRDGAGFGICAWYAPSMRPLALGAIIGTAVGVGVLVGRATMPARSIATADTDASHGPAETTRRSGSSRLDEPAAARDRAVSQRSAGSALRTRGDVDREDEDAPTRREGDSPRADPPAPSAEIDDERSPSEEIARLQRELTELREEAAELMGEPLPPAANPEPRFTAAALGGSVQQAIDQAGVGGSVEHIDCSEDPCIVFGRLVGDEADMEKIERTAALAPYESDVLTLLFWATSLEGPDPSGIRETGLFALAYYSLDARAERGTELDRRLRARTVEYWNTDKPGRVSSGSG